MAEPIWNRGSLIASEQLSKRLQQDEQKWAKLLCVHLGNTIPLTLQEVTSNPNIQKIVQKNIETLNANYRCMKEGKPIPLPVGSRFSVQDTKEIQVLYMKQAICAQQFPWIKLALLGVTDANNKIKEDVVKHLEDCLSDIYHLLESPEDVSIRKCRLANLKSFLVSQICLLETGGGQVNTLTWESALDSWVQQHVTSNHPFSSRISEIQKALCSISCLKKPPSDEEWVTINHVKNIDQEINIISFRSFVATKTAVYIQKSFDIRKEYVKILTSIFEKNEFLRIQALYYCDTLLEIRKQVFKNKLIGIFFPSVDKELQPLRTQLAQEFYSKIENMLKESDFPTILKTELQKKPIKITEFYTLTKNAIPAEAQPHFLQLSALLDQFYTIEKFYESAVLLCSHDLQTEQSTRNIPGWHPFDLYFEGSSGDRETLKNAYSISNNVDNAVYKLYNFEIALNFSIPLAKKLSMAVKFQQKESTGVAISKIIEEYNKFSTKLSEPVSPLERLEFLLLHPITSTIPFFSKYANTPGARIPTECEYLQALRASLSEKFFISALEKSIHAIKFGPKFDEIISLCIHGPRKDFVMHNHEFFIASAAIFIEKLKKYEFSNFQNILIMLEYIRSKSEQTLSHSHMPQEDQHSSIIHHKDMLENLEHYLRLQLPKALAFSWFVYHEMNETLLRNSLSQLNKLRDLETQNVGTIQQLSDIVFKCMPPENTLKELPEANIHYKTAIGVFIFRSIYTMAVGESPNYTPEYFFPKTLPYPNHPIPSIFSSATPDDQYHNQHIAFISSWNRAKDGFFDCSLSMVKNPCFLETYSATFRLEISKKRLMELYQENSFAYAFLRQLFSYFLSDMSFFVEYCGDRINVQKAPKYLTTALSTMLENKKISNYQLIATFIHEPSHRKYAKELEAIFTFAYQIHHFVRKNFVKFSKGPCPPHASEDVLELVSQGTIYDGGDTISLLPFIHPKFKDFSPCFSMQKNNKVMNTRKELFYNDGNVVEKTLLYDLQEEENELKVTISLQEKPSLFLCMTYPKNSFLSSEQMTHLINWQTLLLKSKVYSVPFQDVSVSHLTQELAVIEL